MASNPPKFTELNDLTCEEIGGKILFATDDWFACKFIYSFFGVIQKIFQLANFKNTR